MRPGMGIMLAAAGMLVGAVNAAGQAPPERSDAALVLEIQRLCQVDPSIADPAEQAQAHVAALRKAPALLAELAKRFPDSEYLPAAHSLALDALMIRREKGDKTVTDREITAVATYLAGQADNEFRAKGKYVLLELQVMASLAQARKAIPASMPASAPAVRAAQAEVTRRQRLFAAKFVALAGELPKTACAPLALYVGAGLHLQSGQAKPAIAAYDRLVLDYPKDPCSLDALMILVRLHTAAGRHAQALAAKRRCVDHFGSSEAAQAYKADIARAESLGKPFFLRFRSARGQSIDITKLKGKTVLVYFYVSALDGPAGGQALKTMGALAKLAAERGCVLLAVGADPADSATKVAAALNAAKIDTPNLLDPESQVAAQYGVMMVPSVTVVSPKGLLSDIITTADIVPAVSKTLAAAPTSRPAK